MLPKTSPKETTPRTYRQTKWTNEVVPKEKRKESVIEIDGQGRSAIQANAII
jgi:hypothetical protein